MLRVIPTLVMQVLDSRETISGLETLIGLGLLMPSSCLRYLMIKMVPDKVIGF